MYCLEQVAWLVEMYAKGEGYLLRIIYMRYIHRNYIEIYIEILHTNIAYNYTIRSRYVLRGRLTVQGHGSIVLSRNELPNGPFPAPFSHMDDLNLVKMTLRAVGGGASRWGRRCNTLTQEAV